MTNRVPEMKFAVAATVAVALVACSSTATTPASPTELPPTSTATVAATASPTMPLVDRTAAPVVNPQVAAVVSSTTAAPEVALATTRPSSVVANVKPAATTPSSRTFPHSPAYCVAPVDGEPQDIVDTPAAPYFVRHPAGTNSAVPTIVFLGGGSGSRRSAQRLWTNYLSGGNGVDDFRVVLPYSVDVEYYDYDQAQRTFRVVDEVLACYGGEPDQVHLAGFSNGGETAFELMLQHPDRFATLLGAPGLFPRLSKPEQWARALCGHAVFNGVGALDEDWKSDVRATHEGLLSAGITSAYVEFEGQKHSLNEAFDETVFFDFWRANGPARATHAGSC